jgi:hypothetical protein
MPPTLQAFSILLKVLLLLFELKGQIVSEESFLFIGVVDLHHDMPDDFFLSVILAVVQFAHKRIIMIVFVKITPQPAFPEASHKIQVSKGWVLDQISILPLPPLIPTDVSAHLEAH